MPSLCQQGLRIHRTDSRHHQRQQEDDSRAQESISLTRPPPTPAVVTTPPNIMTRMTQNGISTTQDRQEQYETFYSAHRGRRITRVMYDYRTQDGELFSIVAPTLRECRRKRDEWLAKRDK